MATTHERIEAILQQAAALIAELQTDDRYDADPVWYSTNYHVGMDLFEKGWSQRNLGKRAMGVGFTLAALAELPEDAR